MATKYRRDELIAEFRWTWSRHHGSLTDAAHILGMQPASLERAFLRARADGVNVEFTNDIDRRASNK